MTARRSSNRISHSLQVAGIGAVIALCVFLHPTWAGDTAEPTKLQVTADRDTLYLGETLQLTVTAQLDDGSMRDVTTDPATQYFPTSSHQTVVVDPGGLVKALALPHQASSPYIQESSSVGIMVTYQNVGAVVNLVIREVEGKYLEVTAAVATLQVGETTQLTVTRHDIEEGVRDVSSDRAGTTYFTTSESTLIPESDGQVTCIGTRGKPMERSVIGVRNGDLKGSMSLQLIAGGPGPGLEVMADEVLLREGERTQLHVYRFSPQGGREEVTATSSGTRYLTFPGYGRHDPSVVSIDEAGRVSATDSIGHYNRRTVVVFVRSGDSVGWTELTVVPVASR